MQRFLLLICGLFLCSGVAFAQDSCPQDLARAKEDLAILQDLHGLITVPRAEADQRTLILIQRKYVEMEKQLRQTEAELASLKNGGEPKKEKPSAKK